MRMSFDFNKYTVAELAELVQKAGGQRAFARAYGVPRTTVQMHLNKEGRTAFHHREPLEPQVRELSGDIHRYILTAAQDETVIHPEFLSNLEAYRDYLAKDGPCELIIAGFTYNKKLFENHDAEKAPYWHPRIEQYLVHDRVRLGDRIDFCGEMNTLPTAVTPLTGFEPYTRDRWGIFPHAKVQLVSVPTMKNSPAKIIMTTGAVTKTNYVRKRAGIRASFHHALGAVLVEIAKDGTFFCRHLLGEEDGSFYDLDRYIETATRHEAIAGSFDSAAQNIEYATVNEYNYGTVITIGHNAAAINWGDLHVANIDPNVSKACFGLYPTETRDVDGRLWKRHDGETMLDALKPSYQFFHDVADFESRNHHNLRDPHHMFALHVHGCESVENEMREVSFFIDQTRRPGTRTVIVESNHDLALKRWLKEADYKADPLNAIFFLDCQSATYQAIKRKEEGFSIFEHVLTTRFPETPCDGVDFLREDESFMVLGIEKGMHGHLGANGAKGTPLAFTKMGPKATTGHTHSCGIRDGIYTSGTSSQLDMGYNKGLSSWSHSHVLTYQNGKRTILTMQGEKWRL